MTSDIIVCIMKETSFIDKYLLIFKEEMEYARWRKHATNDETNAKMQKKMAQEQEKLKEERIVGTAGGGMVAVTVTGHKEVVDVEIKEEAVDPDDIEMLQDLVLAATNEAMNKADELTQERLGKHTQGLNIPGM